MRFCLGSDARGHDPGTQRQRPILSLLSTSLTVRPVDLDFPKNRATSVSHQVIVGSWSPVRWPDPENDSLFGRGVIRASARVNRAFRLLNNASNRELGAWNDI